MFQTMITLSEAAVLDALKVVRDPDLNRDIVSLKFIKDLRIDGGRVAFSIELTTPACPVKDQMREQARAAVSAIPGVTSVDVKMTAQVRSTTADLGSLYPRGIKVGVVTSVGQTDTDPYKQVQVEPYVDTSSLHSVLVLVPENELVSGP